MAAPPIVAAATPAGGADVDDDSFENYIRIPEQDSGKKQSIIAKH